jgi:hypothetical protein
MNHLNIFFHGASVTEQGGEESYFYQLNQLISKVEFLSIKKKGYGGCHFNDAGFLTIDDDTNIDIDFCFFEWCTTSVTYFEESKLNYVVAKLFSKKIIPIFLILRRTDNLQDTTSRMCENQVINYCKSNNVMFFDYRNIIIPSEDLRDVVHTNIRGAKKYANQLFKDLQNLSESYPLPRLNFNFLEYEINCIKDLNICIQEEGEIILNFTNITVNSELVIETIAGPASPIIEVNNGYRKICLWDEYSHYDRVAYSQISNNFLKISEGSGQVIIRVTSDPIDYSICRRDFKYNEIKFLTIKSIYAVNCKILRDFLLNY